MKLNHLLLLAIISTSLSFISCKDNSGEATTEGQSTTSPEGATATNPATAGMPASAGSEPHYKCMTEGCNGQSDVQGKCPTCGNDLAHNQAFHTQPGSVPGSSPGNAVPVTPTGANGSSTQPAPFPAKNANGEYHYTCAKGHEGAAAAGNCATCGDPLAHNQAYHNN